MTNIKRFVKNVVVLRFVFICDEKPNVKNVVVLHFVDMGNKKLIV
jgi:hypothetical protein